MSKLRFFAFLILWVARDPTVACSPQDITNKHVPRVAGKLSTGNKVPRIQLGLKSIYLILDCYFPWLNQGKADVSNVIPCIQTSRCWVDQFVAFCSLVRLCLCGTFSAEKETILEAEWFHLQCFDIFFQGFLQLWISRSGCKISGFNSGRGRALLHTKGWLEFGTVESEVFSSHLTQNKIIVGKNSTLLPKNMVLNLYYKQSPVQMNIAVELERIMK